MKLRELESECIRYTAEDKDMGLTAESYVQYKNKETYKDYINNVLPAINRAIARIVSKNKIPYKTYAIAPKKTYTKQELEEEFNIAIRDIYSVTSISPNGNLVHFKFHYIANKLTIVDLSDALVNNSLWSLNINFIPFIRTLKRTDEEDQTQVDWETNDTSIELEDLGIPDDLCYSVIVYYVKADLFAMDNPSLALTYRQYADNYLELYDIYNTIVEKQDCVRADASILGGF